MPPGAKSNMPSFDKSPTELVDFFNATMSDFPQATLRKTFGYPCAYVNGHMSTGLHADALFLRLSPADEAEFLKMDGASSFAPMANRPMKGYVVAPPALRGNATALKSWIARSLEYVSTLPPKEKKTPRPKRG